MKCEAFIASNWRMVVQNGILEEKTHYRVQCSSFDHCFTWLRGLMYGNMK